MAEEKKRSFEVLRLMGIFWMVFGAAVLVATFFVQENQYIDKYKGQIANLVGGALIFLIGLGVYVKGHFDAKKKKA